MNFVTVNVEPQMSVIANKYRSALGKILYSLFVIALLNVPSGCGDERSSTLTDEKFQKIYGDILFLGELHRNDSTAMHKALDSLLEVHNVDTTTLFASARELAVDPERSAELYSVLIARFETQSADPDFLEDVEPIQLVDSTTHPVPNSVKKSDTVRKPGGSGKGDSLPPPAPRKSGPRLTGKE